VGCLILEMQTQSQPNNLTQLPANPPALGPPAPSIVQPKTLRNFAELATLDVDYVFIGFAVLTTVWAFQGITSCHDLNYCGLLPVSGVFGMILGAAVFPYRIINKSLARRQLYWKMWAFLVFLPTVVIIIIIASIATLDSLDNDPSDVKVDRMRAFGGIFTIFCLDGLILIGDFLKKFLAFMRYRNNASIPGDLQMYETSVMTKFSAYLLPIGGGPAVPCNPIVISQPAVHGQMPQPQYGQVPQNASPPPQMQTGQYAPMQSPTQSPMQPQHVQVNIDLRDDRRNYDKHSSKKHRKDRDDRRGRRSRSQSRSSRSRTPPPRP